MLIPPKTARPGHYNRALEEAVQSNKSQWPTTWSENPLAGTKTFTTLDPADRVCYTPSTQRLRHRLTCIAVSSARPCSLDYVVS